MAQRSGGMGRKRRKACHFCVDKVQHIDYKDHLRLRRYLTDRGKILPRRVTGTCAAHQRALTEAIKLARQIALLPFAGLIEQDRPEGGGRPGGRAPGRFGGGHREMANAVPAAAAAAPAPAPAPAPAEA